ncbi:MAG TPA: tRNA preQ1(34) S-adenosylmethionine ribosyltransferase-isomerase QueA [Gammaproteobacteria bacterium]|jgi:S-adenosylmethionine:tRNA ribosyltransferase-isomerase|nr:tRNA preQ1(34) S-adenosylmethionine ribosyltransferase-isomerase QueA [Gammaproteobacteria bacterium]
MQLSDFNFILPPELIARYPLSERSMSRLLCVQHDTLAHQHFNQVIDLIHPGDLLVFNDTKVIPARLIGQKQTGGRVEILIERILDRQRVLAQVRVSKPPRVGDQLLFANDISLTVLDRQQQFYELSLAAPNQQQTILDMIETIGQIPLPPYMQREADENDKTRYQTVYAKHKGSVAAPTAGLHFDEALLQKLRDKQIEMGHLTLHIGAGTFLPVRVDDITQHQMHPEYLQLSESLCQQITAAKARGNRVIAVGTTSLRALETASQSGEITPYAGETTIFIYPGYTFRCADALITNLHLPGSTLLMLVCAFGGHAAMLRAYETAVAEKYRFYSYGDAMWIDLG